MNPLSGHAVVRSSAAARVMLARSGVLLFVLVLSGHPGQAAVHHRHGASRHPSLTPPSASRAALEAARAREIALRQQQQQEARRLANARQTDAQASALASQDRARATRLSAATVTAAGQLQDTEEKMQDITSRMSDLQEERRQVESELHADAQALAPVLPVAQRLSLYPVDTLLTQPLPADDTIRGLLVLRGLSTTIENRAETLRTHQAQLTQLNSTLAEQQHDLEALESRQTTQKDALARQADAARAAQLRSNAAAREAASRSADEARRNRELQAELAHIVATESAAMAQLQREAEQAERERRKREAAAAAARARSVSTPAASLPPVHSSGRQSSNAIVAGRLLSGWGERTEAGPASGNTYATAAGASVRSPCSGSVEFASPFRSYGQMLILNCGRGYRFVLGGLGSLNVATGQSLARGAAVGAMPASGSPTLLVQLRRGTKPVDPSTSL
ncbi:murein hydrolase activator EnvC family protein [Acetobacter estunensis]|nr:peptidoglycan DD-metalloendopeptidase family protein [Acetobacter estunensis]